MIYTAIIISRNRLRFCSVESLLEKHTIRVFFEELSFEEKGCAFMEYAPQLVIIEHTEIDADILSLTSRIREGYSGVLVVVSDSPDVSSQVLALHLGVDAALSWQSGAAFVTANIQALVRRFIAQHPERVLRFGDLTIDKRKRDAFVGNNPLRLSTMEFRIIWLLAHYSGEVVSRDRIHRGIYDRPYNGFDRSVDLYISRIRQKIGDSPASSTYVKTIRGVGYQFISP